MFKACLAFLAMIIILALAGCGTSSAPSGKITIDGHPTTLKVGKVSKEDYTRQINTKCTSMQHQIIAETNKEIALYTHTSPDHPVIAPKLTGGQRVQLIMVATVPVVQRWLDQMVTVKVPQADVAELADFYQDYQDALTKLKKKPGLLLKSAVFSAADQKADEYGLYACQMH